jgi:hypothetical protein
MLGSVRQSASDEHGMSVQKPLTVTQQVWQPARRQSHWPAATSTHSVPACGQPPSQVFVSVAKWQGSVVDVVVVLVVVETHGFGSQLPGPASMPPRRRHERGRLRRHFSAPRIVRQHRITLRAEATPLSENATVNQKNAVQARIARVAVDMTTSVPRRRTARALGTRDRGSVLANSPHNTAIC